MGDCSSLWVGFQSWDLLSGASKGRYLKHILNGFGGMCEIICIVLRVCVSISFSAFVVNCLVFREVMGRV